MEMSLLLPHLLQLRTIWLAPRRSRSLCYALVTSVQWLVHLIATGYNAFQAYSTYLNESEFILGYQGRQERRDPKREELETETKKIMTWKETGDAR